MFKKKNKDKKPSKKELKRIIKEKEEELKRIEEKTELLNYEKKIKELEKKTKKLSELNEIQNPLTIEERNWKKDKKLLRHFKGVCMLFLTIDGKGKWLENVITGAYQFTHSDGDLRTISITGSPIELNWGDESVKMYICHEDHPFPIPSTAIFTSQQYTNSIEKISADLLDKKLKLKKVNWDGFVNLIKWAAIAVGGLLLVGGILSMVAPNFEVCSLIGTCKDVVDANTPAVQDIIKNNVTITTI